ncbi:MAG TPA: sugar phosphate isomerase/epimerase family protein [Acidimicrobiia bacterium]|nr:sugar phosphate isomerase/epimerase family protein [Acidimicrobiia bacterium]
MAANELCLNLFQYSTMLGKGAPLDSALAAARDAGFQLVGLDVFTLDDAGLAPGEARALLDRHGVRCFEILGLAVGASEEETMEAARRAARWVGETGAEWVLTVVDAPVDAAVVDRFARAAGVVADAGGRLALEFLPHLAVSTIADARRVCDAAGADRAAVLVDSWHVFRGTNSLADVAAMPAEAIAYVQFDDALPLAGELADEVMARRVWPGDGEFPLADFADAIRATGYAGPVSIEVLNAEWRDRGLDVRDFANDAARTCTPYWT